MIAVDTSALVALVLKEEMENGCLEALGPEPRRLISAGTFAEALIVAAGRNIVPEMLHLIDRLNLEIVPVTGESARRVGDAYAKWGKGLHPARLNFGDCFAYDVAKSHSCKLLFVGDDFSRTDLQSAL